MESGKHPRSPSSEYIEPLGVISSSPHLIFVSHLVLFFFVFGANGSERNLTSEIYWQSFFVETIGKRPDGRYG